MHLRLLLIAALLLGAFQTVVDAASLTVRRQGGESEFAAELGELLDMEVVIDAGSENVTGYTFFLSFDSDVFRLVTVDEGEQSVPFVPGPFLRGIALVNRVELVGDEIFLNYTEASGGGEQRAVGGTGVVARFSLEVMRRSTTSRSSIRIESRGHDRVSHYVTADESGVEKRFDDPLGEALVQVTGFRILPLPDVTVIEGEAQVVFDLDAFVDTAAATVIWTNSRLSEVPTRIDPDSREVIMDPLAGQVGNWEMRFTAFEVNEGLTAEDTVKIKILSRPQITNFPDSIIFAEDTINQEFDLDAFVVDVDDLDAELSWTVSGGVHVLAEIDSNNHIARFVATPDFFGEEQLTFVVGDATALSDTVTALVLVTPVNDPPKIKRVPPVYPVQGEEPLAVPLADLVEDRDDDLAHMQFFLKVDEGLRVEIEGENLLIHGDAPGRRIVGITVQDTSGAIDDGRQVAVVLEPGESVGPQIGRLPKMRLRGGQTGTLNLDELVQDDSPVDSLTWTALPDSGLTVIVENRRLLVGGESGFAGKGEVRLTATDPQGNQESAVLQVSLLRPEDGMGPQIFDPGKIGLLADGEAQLDLDEMVDDPDHLDGDIEWSFFPSGGLEFDAETRTLRPKEGEELIRPASLTLKATDPAGESDEITVSVLVAVPGDPPQVRDFPEVRLDSLAAEVKLDLDEFVFDDEDFETELVWTAEPEPGVEVKVDPVSHVLKVRRSEAEGLPAAVTQVLLKVLDTTGQERTAILKVGLPPLFELRSIPDIQLSPGQVDTSLVLDDYIISSAGQLAVEWEVDPTDDVDARIDAATHRVRLEARDATFQGSETLTFTVTDATGRSQTIPLRVVVKGQGLPPQLRKFPRLEIEDGQVDTSIDLDEFVVDDDSDSLLQWSVSGQRQLRAEIDPITRVLTLSAEGVTPALERIQFLVRDPAGNSAIGVMEVLLLRGGKAPQISPLPQILLLAGGEEKQLELSPFVADADTPREDIEWEVTAEPGIAARIEESRLVMAVPAGQSGRRTLLLTAIDPQGNRMTAEMRILIQEDVEAPTLGLEVKRHPIFSEMIELRILPSEKLPEAPQVWVEGDLVEAVPQGEGSYAAFFSFSQQSGERLIDVLVRAVDRSGNEVRRELTLSLSWMNEQGGNISSPDQQVMLNVPTAASGPGHLAMLYSVGEAEKPVDSDDQPVYAMELLRDRSLPHPVTVNFRAGVGADPDLGILRWDEENGRWEELPTVVDEETGRLSTTVAELGLFRLGTVDSENRRASSKLHSYPNPFSGRNGGYAQIVYQLSTAGEVQLNIINILGQPVRTLVDEFQQVGMGSAVWDGRDANGGEVGSGIYFYELREGGQRHCKSLILIR